MREILASVNQILKPEIRAVFVTRELKKKVPGETVENNWRRNLRKWIEGAYSVVMRCLLEVNNSEFWHLPLCQFEQCVHSWYRSARRVVIR